MGELMTFITPVACGLLSYFLILKKFVSKSNLAFTDTVQQTLSISTTAKFLPFAVDNSKILKLLKIRRIPYFLPPKSVYLVSRKCLLIMQFSSPHSFLDRSQWRLLITSYPDSPALHAEQLRFPNQTHKEPRFA